jgi:hypothetical protein
VHNRSGEFRKVGQNLFRHSANKVYYASCKIAGKKIWKSLETTNLLADDIIESPAIRGEPRPEAATWIGPLSEQYRDLCQIEDTSDGAGTVAFIERLLHETGVLKALARPSWMP